MTWTSLIPCALRLDDGGSVHRFRPKLKANYAAKTNATSFVLAGKLVFHYLCAGGSLLSQN